MDSLFSLKGLDDEGEDVPMEPSALGDTELTDLLSNLMVKLNLGINDRSMHTSSMAAIRMSVDLFSLVTPIIDTI